MNWLITYNLNVVTDGSFSVLKTLFTSNFHKLKEKSSQHCSVAIQDPKGCEKTVLCAAMYLMLQKEFGCLYLTSRSFQYNPICVSYFKAFYEQHKNCFDEEFIFPGKYEDFARV